MNNSINPPSETQPASHQVPWTMREIWIGLTLLLIWLLVSLGFGYARETLNWQFDIGYFLVLWELVLILPAWWLTIRKYRLSWDSLGLRNFDLTSLAIGCGLMIFTVFFNFFFNLYLVFKNIQPTIEINDLFNNGASPWLIFLTGIGIAPLVEEIFFRGFIYTGMREKYGWIAAALISSALFAGVHLQPISMPPIFLMGLIFAYLYERTRSIWPAVIMHFATNALSLAAAYMLSQLESNLF
jgi:membrane protease YdiL (CAAX protease family)